MSSVEPVTYRIDVHHHVVPPFYVDALRQGGLIESIPGVPFPNWSLDATLAMLDKQGIASALLSISEPGVYFGEKVKAQALAHRVNIFLAELVQNHSTRLGGFAALPLPDVGAALREMEYALDTLKLDGVGLLSNYRGTYLGSPQFEELFAELNRRRVPIFIHPSTPPAKDQPLFGLPASLYEFPFDTTRMVVNMLYSGMLERYPNLRIILSHAGGTIPYLAKRIAHGAMLEKVMGERNPENLLAQLRRFYYDVAMSISPYALPSLQALADPSRILYGSDYPFVPEPAIQHDLKELRAYNGFNPGEARLIERENALLLFPRFKN
ncbi:amidohydrolase family protein [Ktedonospora formicarum]|uniref:Amidohydrolase n=1 Tax=Ktedonospora formicarum TaxID=2778364 RepID=A0A8J3MX90_9CHLR|nr:amidohydrolase family protein [Ktedonospora formicarum]GHO49498.1 amidohydrolase [Ktedonospora formicarum]